MAVWERFGAARVLARARSAELRGELGQAVTLFAQARRLDEAARVLVLRGDAEADPALRLRHYTQAAAMAPAGSAAAGLARRKRARLLLGAAADRPLTATLRQDLLEAASELEALDELEVAAQAYGRAGDVEGEARSLARAGDIDRLERLLSAEQGRNRASIARHDLQERAAVVAASGRRREAVALARSGTEEALHDQARALEARRVSGSVVHVWVRGQRMRLALGARITIGRAATLSIASAAVSREHLVIERRAEDAVVRDLGSRNGTTLRGRGLALAGEVLVGTGLELQLGQQIAVVVRPSSALAGAFDIELLGSRYTASLGPARLGVGRWSLEAGQGDDAWVELVTDDDPPAFLDGLSVGPRVSLLAGDAFATERAGEPVVRLEGV